MKFTPRRTVIGLAATMFVVLQSTSAGAVETEVVASPSADMATQQLQTRVDHLKKILPGKLNRKSKLVRGKEFSEWQKAWGSANAPEPFDQPQEAQTYFMAKRLSQGQTTLDLSTYAPAVEQTLKMPIFSTRKNQFIAATSAQAAPSIGSIAPATTSQTGTWEAMGPGNIGGRTRAILIHPTTPSTMWTAGVGGGIWKSTDSGASWVPKADLLVNIGVNSMVLDPRNPNTIYAGTGEGYGNVDSQRGAGIMKSTDGGETWTQLPSTNNSNFFYVQKLVMSKGSSQRLYAATATGIFRSNDAGGTWTKMLDASTVRGCMDLAIQTDRALANVFASCGTFAQASIYRAIDTAGAQTWTKVQSVTGMGRTSLAIAPSNQNIIYAMASNKDTHGLLAIFRSNSSGAAGTWTTQVDSTSPNKLNTLLLSNPVIASLAECGFGASSTSSQGWYDQSLAVDPVNPDIVWAGGIDLFRSDDGGKNWGQSSHWWFTEGTDPWYNHADQHTVVFHPQYNGTTNKIMYTGNDGGVHVTQDARAPVAYSPSPINPASPVCGNITGNEVMWDSLNNGYAVTQFYHGAVYPNGDFITGAQDNGTMRGTVGSQIATKLNGGDGGYVAVNPNNTQMLWLETTNKSMKRSIDGGVTYDAFTSGIAEPSGNFTFIAPFAQDPSNPSIMWTAGATPWRTDAATAIPLPAAIWQKAGQFAGFRIGAIAVSPVSSDRVYYGTIGQGKVWTTNAGTTATASTVWTSGQPRSGSSYVSWIEPDPVDVNTVYATISTFNTGTSVGHVFKSIDAGATWASIDGSGATALPDVPALSMAIDPTNNQRLYVGTDLGVFVSTDGGANWARENTGFANVSVETLVIKNVGAARYIYAFTHGRSVFRALLP